MSLEFQPAPTWLLQEYANRKRPGEILNESLGTAISGYAKAKQDQKTQELAQEDRDIKMAALASEGGTNALDALAKIKAERNAPTTPLGQGPSIIDRFKSWIGTAPVGKSPDQMTPTPSTGTASGYDPYANVPGMTPPTPEGKPVAPDLGSDPAIEEFNQIGSQAYIEKYGRNGLAKVKTALDIQKGLQDKAKQNVSIGQYSALQTGDAEALSREYPEGIPQTLATSALASQSRNVRVTQDPYGNPIRVPVAGGPATPIDIPTNNQNPLQRKLNPNEYKNWVKEVDDFDADPVVKSDRTMLATLNQINSEINNYNPALTGPLQSQQARAIAREVGALTDSDIARQSIDPSLLGRLKKVISVATTGKLPPDQLELLKQTVKTINDSASRRIQSIAQERSTRKSSLYGGKVSPEELLQTLRLPTSFSQGRGLDPAGKARIAELRAKRAAGTLQR